MQRFAELYPESEHVQNLGLGTADDAVIWEYAHRHGMTIVSKDGDYADISELRGFPPKVIWIRRGNCRVTDIEILLRQYAWAIDSFSNDSERGCLIIQ